MKTIALHPTARTAIGTALVRWKHAYMRRHDAFHWASGFEGLALLVAMGVAFAGAMVCDLLAGCLKPLRRS